jgi:aminopeptidase YwaD
MAMRVDPERLWQHLRVLCEEIGPRLSGTPGDERATAFIVEQLRRAGADVEVQDYPCPGWQHGETELALRSEAGTETLLPAVAQTFTEGCDVEARLTCVGLRDELEFAPDLEGKTLVLYGEAASRINVDRNRTLLSAEERRPAALVVVSPSETVSTKLIRDPFLRVPAVAVARSIGEQLREREGDVLRLRLRARRYPSVGHNVIGRIAGETSERIAVAAHYDTAANVSGATDNASGTAVVLALCEEFATTGRRRFGIDFVAYGAEEYGRHAGNLGAVEYVRRHPLELKQTRALVEIDCVGTVAGPVQARITGWSPSELPTKKDEVLSVLRGHPPCLVDDRSENPSATTAFHLPGVPSIAFVDDYDHLPIHTAQDTIDLIRLADLAHVAEVVAATVECLAG